MKSKLKHDKHGDEVVIIEMSPKEASELIDVFLEVGIHTEYAVAEDLYDQLHDDLNLCTTCNPDSNGYPDEDELDV